MALTTTKYSLDELLASAGAEHHNSNLQNIANAIRRIDATRKHLDKWEGQLRDMANAPEEVELDDLRSLYDRVCKNTVNI